MVNLTGKMKTEKIVNSHFSYQHCSCHCSAIFFIWCVCVHLCYNFQCYVELWWQHAMWVRLRNRGKYSIGLQNWLPMNFSIKAISKSFNSTQSQLLWWTGKMQQKSAVIVFMNGNSYREWLFFQRTQRWVASNASEFHWFNLFAFV